MHSARPACGFALRMQRSILRSTVYVCEAEYHSAQRDYEYASRMQDPGPMHTSGTEREPQSTQNQPEWRACTLLSWTSRISARMCTYVCRYVCMYVYVYVCMYVGRPPVGRPWLHLPQHRAGGGKSQGRAPLKANSRELLPGFLEQSRTPQDQVRELRPQGVKAHQGDAEVCHQAAEAAAARHG